MTAPHSHQKECSLNRCKFRRGKFSPISLKIPSLLLLEKISKEYNIELLFQNGHDFNIIHNIGTFCRCLRNNTFLPETVLKCLDSYSSSFLISTQFLFQFLFIFISRGGKFLEAPVSGSKVPADMAQLIFLCAGDEEVLMCY